MTFSTGTLLGGKLRYSQTIAGHRSGFEPVLLAATIPARTGEHIIEAGTGAGAALLCLRHRIGPLHGFGLERDAGLASLAADNFRDNQMPDLRAIAADVTAPPLRGPFDHALANPPWFSPLATTSPDARRHAAHHAPPNKPPDVLLRDWTQALGLLLKPRGTLTFILPAALLDTSLHALTTNRFGAATIIPLWPRRGRPAKLIIVQAMKHARGPLTLQPGLTLHDDCGLTKDAQTLLRDGTAWPNSTTP